METRKQERAAACAALPPEQQTLVDGGQIRVGMTEDAVYIVWGKPAQVLEQENAQARRPSGFTKAAGWRKRDIGRRNDAIPGWNITINRGPTGGRKLSS